MKRMTRSTVGSIAALLIATGMTLGLGVTPSFAATTASPVTTVVTVKSSINPYGCGALTTLGYRQMYVAAFALGYCPTVFTLQGTSWGRSFTNWIDNGLCRVPWIVWAATGGRYTSC